MVTAHREHRHTIARVLVAVMLSCAFPVAATEPESERQQQTLRSGEIGKIQDLHYGEVLFYNYQEKHFSALIALLVSRQRGRISHHGEDAQSLLGGLKLSYGMHLEAEQIFRRLLDESTSPEVRNRAWFYLGKLLYQKGYYPVADAALAEVDSGVGTEIGAEQRLLRAYIAMKSKNPAAALAGLENWRNMPSAWRVFGQYNLGIAHLQQGNTEMAMAILEQLSKLSPVDDEIYSLRDKANLDIGYRLLGERDFTRARSYLNQVRLQGPYSNLALLGSGWADSEAGNFKRALSPWIALSERDATDASVLEALLAVPYAYGEVDAYAQAARSYRRAIDVYEYQDRALRDAVDSVSRGDFLKALLDSTRSGRGRTGLSINGNTGLGLGYFPELISDHGFLEAYKNLREIQNLKANLTGWQRSIGAFEQMLSNRVDRFRRQLPSSSNYIGQLDLDTARNKHQLWKSALAKATEGGDLLFFATAEDKAMWAKVESVASRLRRIRGYPEASGNVERQHGFSDFVGGRGVERYRSGEPLSQLELRHRPRVSAKKPYSDQVLLEHDVIALDRKTALLRGVLQWKLQYQYFARKRVLEKSLAQLGEQIELASVRNASLLEARRRAPVVFTNLEGRIANSRKRLAALQKRLDKVELRLRGHIESLTVERLLSLQQRVENYAMQAKYSLAQIYDRAAIDEGRPPPAANPVESEQ